VRNFQKNVYGIQNSSVMGNMYRSLLLHAAVYLNLLYVQHQIAHSGSCYKVVYTSPWSDSEYMGYMKQYFQLCVTYASIEMILTGTLIALSVVHSIECVKWLIDRFGTCMARHTTSEDEKSSGLLSDSDRNFDLRHDQESSNLSSAETGAAFKSTLTNRNTHSRLYHDDSWHTDRLRPRSPHQKRSKPLQFSQPVKQLDPILDEDNQSDHFENEDV